MKKRIIGAVIAAVVMMLLFAACSDEPQLVAWEKAEKVAKVDVTQISGFYFVIISWDAAKNGTGYDVYAQQKDTKTLISCGYGQNKLTYRVGSTGTPLTSIDSIDNTEIDKWSKCIAVQYTYIYGTGGSATTYTRGDLPPGTYRFGVQTRTALTNTNPSDIKWSDDFTVIGPPAVTGNSYPY